MGAMAQFKAENGVMKVRIDVNEAVRQELGVQTPFHSVTGARMEMLPRALATFSRRALKVPNTVTPVKIIVRSTVLAAGAPMAVVLRPRVLPCLLLLWQPQLGIGIVAAVPVVVHTCHSVQIAMDLHTVIPMPSL
jgi:hypothetical protein